MNVSKVLLILLMFCSVSCAYAQDAMPIRAHKDTESKLVQQLREMEWTPLTGQKHAVDEQEEAQKLVRSILEYAKKHIGCRYHSGGKGPKVFDCSGFVGYVYRHFGFKMGQSSRDQYLQGVPVETKELKPGDLVFFGTHRTKNVGHVGIVTSVNPETGAFQFIHAANTVGITINKYPDGGYYSRTYIGAKRIL